MLLEEKVPTRATTIDKLEERPGWAKRAKGDICAVYEG